MISALVDQWLGVGLVCAFFLFVVRDALVAIAARHVEPTAEDVGKPSRSAEESESR